MKTIAILIACSFVAAAHGQVLRPGPETRQVRMDRTQQQLIVEDPTATKTRAWVAPPNGAVKAFAAAGRSFNLHNRVIIKADDAEVTRIASTHNVDMRPLEVHGYWELATTDVGHAIEVAEQVASDPSVEVASVDADGLFDLRTVPTDPKFNLQWHLENEIDPLFDVNAAPAWGAGLSGAGVVIGVLDSAVQIDHPDLAPNYLPEGSSIGANAVGSSHGTAVAGIAAAAGNNGLMGAGAAFNAQFTAHLLSTNSATAEALAFRNDLNDVRNNSWGPFDLNIVHQPAAVIMDAIRQAAEEGRGGKGTILVWAGGNGGAGGDRVDYDPYASSRYTLAINSIGDQDTAPAYSERGSSVALATQSDGNNRGIYTTSAGSSETGAFGGTSAAAPLASGVVALMLEARPDLHWRDVREILINTARQCDINDEAWQLNGAGRAIHYRYGHGAIDAGAAIDAAMNWQRLSHEVTATSGVVPVDQLIPDRNNEGVTIDIDITDDILIETVELVLNVDSPFIGDLTVDLVSPEGTSSALLRRRAGDSARNLNDYVLTSLRHYGEQSAGTWQVNISDRARGDVSTWVDAEIRVQGQPLCRLDIDRDGSIGLGDLQGLLQGFGACSDMEFFEPVSDDNNDGCTSLSDLAELLARFGDTCD